MKPVCVLVSGGYDSDVLLGKALRQGRVVYPLYIRSGLRFERAELFWLRRYLRALRQPNLKPLSVLNLPVKALYGPHWSLGGNGVPSYSSDDRRVYLPARNVLLLSLAASFCLMKRIPAVWIGVLKGNPFPDGNVRFFKLLQQAFRAGLRFPLSIKAPFSRLSKEQVVRLGRGLPLRFAFSCLNPRGFKPCWHCNKCAEKIKTPALFKSGRF